MGNDSEGNDSPLSQNKRCFFLGKCCKQTSVKRESGEKKDRLEVDRC